MQLTTLADTEIILSGCFRVSLAFPQQPPRGLVINRRLAADEPAAERRGPAVYTAETKHVSAGHFHPCFPPALVANDLIPPRCRPPTPLQAKPTQPLVLSIAPLNLPQIPPRCLHILLSTTSPVSPLTDCSIPLADPHTSTLASQKPLLPLEEATKAPLATPLTH